MKKQKNKFDDLVKAADKFIKEKKFGPAKDLLFQACRIYSTEELQEKIELCSLNVKKSKSARKVLKDARKLLIKNKKDEAIVLYKKSLKIFFDPQVEQELNEILDDQSLEDKFETAKKFEHNRQYERAREIYLELIALQDNEIYRNRLAISLVKNKRSPAALEHFRLSKKTDSEVSYYYGFALAENKRFSEAIKVLKTLSQNSAVLNFITELERRSSAEKKNLTAYFYENLAQGNYPEADRIFAKIRENQNSFLIIKDTGKFLEQNLAFHYYRDNELQKADKILKRNPSSTKIEDLNNRFSVCFELLEKTELSSETTENLLLETIALGFTYFSSPFFKQKIDEYLPQKFKNFEQNEIMVIFEKAMSSKILKYKTLFPEKAQYLNIFWQTEKDAVQKLGQISRRNKEFKNFVVTPFYAKKCGISGKIIDLLEKTYKRKDESFYHLISLFSNLSDAYRYFLAGETEKGKQLLKSESDKTGVAKKYINLRFEYEDVLTKIKKVDLKFKKHFNQIKPLFKINKKYYEDLVEFLLNFDEDDDKAEKSHKIIEFFIDEFDEKRLYSRYSALLSIYVIDHVKDGQIASSLGIRFLEKALRYDKNNKDADYSLKELLLHKEIESIKKLIDKNKLKKASELAVTSNRLMVKFFVISDFFMQIEFMINDRPFIKPEEEMIFNKIYNDYKNYARDVALSTMELSFLGFDFEHYLELLENKKIKTKEIIDRFDNIIFDEESKILHG